MPLPEHAAWRHVGERREGFEVVAFEHDGDEIVARGRTTGVEEGRPFEVGYELRLYPDWRTRSAVISGSSPEGARQIEVEADGEGGWTFDGAPVPEVEGCLDLDLESSSLTNAFPVNRIGLEPGESADAPAAYVKQFGLGVELLEQRYKRVDDGEGPMRFDYLAVADDFRVEIVYDENGLAVEYPQIATRVL